MFLFVVVLLISVSQAVLLNDQEAYDIMVGAETQNLDVAGTVMDIIGFFFGGFMLKILVIPVYIFLKYLLWIRTMEPNQKNGIGICYANKTSSILVSYAWK